MVDPSQRKQLVEEVVGKGRLSERRACQLMGVSRSAYHYQSKRFEKDDGLKTQLLEQARCHPRYGYLMLHGLLKNEGLVVNKKRTYRLYREAGLQLRTKKRKKLFRVRSIPNTPLSVNERWSMDFVHDQLSDGRRIRVLNVINDFSRECRASS